MTRASRLFAESSACRSLSELPPPGVKEIMGDRSAIAVAVLALGLTGNGCDRRPATPLASSPAAPTPVATASPLPPFTLSGTVYESTASGLKPLAGAPVDISVEYQSWPPKTTTDAEGRYSLSSLGPEKLKVFIDKEGYSQPCRAAVDLKRDSVVDVYVVSNALLEKSGIPPSYPVVQPTLAGRVVERTSSGLTPIAGARVVVDFGALLGWAPSTRTVSDATGRYLLCNIVDAGQGLVLVADEGPSFRVLSSWEERSRRRHSISS